MSLALVVPEVTGLNQDIHGRHGGWIWNYEAGRLFALSYGEAIQSARLKMNLKSLHASLMKHLLRIMKTFQIFINAGGHSTFLASRTRVRALFTSRAGSVSTKTRMAA